MSEETKRTRIAMKWNETAYEYYLLNPCATPENVGDTDKFEFLMLGIRMPESSLQKQKPRGKKNELK